MKTLGTCKNHEIPVVFIGLRLPFQETAFDQAEAPSVAETSEDLDGREWLGGKMFGPREYSNFWQLFPALDSH